MKSVTCLLLCAGASLASANFSFQGLGYLAEGHDSYAHAVSGDGTTIVGKCGVGPESTLGFRWTWQGGMVSTGDLPGSFDDSENWASSFDGSIVAGQSDSWNENVTPYVPRTEPTAWTSSSGLSSLGFPGEETFAQAHAVSYDGSVMAGVIDTADGYRAFRWTPGGGHQLLGYLDGGEPWSWGYGCNANGSVIVGYALGMNGFEAIRWTAETGMVGLGDITGGNFDSIAYACSADGSVIVGAASTEDGKEAMRWTQSGGMVGLGDLPGKEVNAAARAVSADGNMIVGKGLSEDDDGAFLWTPWTGMIDLKDHLISKGLDLTGWTLTEATGLSADGTVICGNGVNPQGANEAWVAKIELIPVPEMDSLTLSAYRFVGGQDTTGTVTLTNPAPPGGAQILLSDNTSALSEPASITIPAGQTSGQFVATSVAVTSLAARQMTASYRARTRTVTVTLTPTPRVATLDLTPSSVVGGNSAMGTITMNIPAEAGGWTITLSDNSSAVTTPPSAFIPAGKTTATFLIGTSPVSVVATRQVYAVFNAVSKTSLLTLNPSPGLDSLTLSSLLWIAGEKGTGTVMLRNASPNGGTVVTLADNSAATTTPANVTIPGGSTSASFDFYTLPVAASTPVTMTASLNSETRTSSTAVVPGPTLMSILLASGTVKGGTSVTATVHIDTPAPPSGIWITLTDNSSAITTPDRVFIPGGMTSGEVVIQTSAVSAGATRLVQAVHGVTRTALLNLTP